MTTQPRSYKQILTSSALVGGAQIINVAVSLVRTKIVAVMLGPAGMGLLGTLSAIQDLAVSIAGMGVSSSGVRQIAEAANTSQPNVVSRVVCVLWRTSLILALLGSVAVVVSAKWISEITFGSHEYAISVAILGLAVLFRIVADSRGALLQGLRRISDLAKAGVIGGVVGTMTTVLLVALLGEQGLAPALAVTAIVSLVVSGWYARRAAIGTCSLSARQWTSEVSELLSLGLAFMGSAVLMLGVVYLVRVILLREVGLTGAGLYQAAWAVGGLYVGVILQAMGTDFYPRLVAQGQDNEQCNRLVNEQIEVSLLLSGTGILATLVLSPLAIRILYSSEFLGAVDLLRWLCLGVALRVVAWPMGYILVARKQRTLFLLVDATWAAVNLCLVWTLVSRFGVEGAGIAFFLSYVVHFGLVYPLARHLTGFRFSSECRQLAGTLVAVVGLVFLGLQFLPSHVAYFLGGLLTVASGLLAIRRLAALVAEDAGFERIRRVLRLFKLAA